MSKCHQCQLKKELETVILSAGSSTNPNWDQSSGDNSSLESEWSNLDSDIETLASSSESNFDRYLEINEDNSVFWDISHSCFAFRGSSDGIFKRKYWCIKVFAEDRSLIVHFETHN